MKEKQYRPIRKILITGFVAILPLIVTFYVLKFIYGIITSNLMPIIALIANAANLELPEPFVGVLTVIAFIVFLFILGLLTRMYVGKMLISFMDKTAANIPVVSKIYTATKQTIDSVGSSSEKNFQKVVMVELFSEGKACMGFVTRNSQALLTSHIDEPCYNVFIPTAPSPITGFVIVVPVSKCRELSMPVGEGIKFILSLGMVNFINMEDIENHSPEQLYND
jgi:uncharacterized membrane protein